MEVLAESLVGFLRGMVVRRQRLVLCPPAPFLLEPGPADYPLGFGRI